MKGLAPFLKIFHLVQELEQFFRLLLAFQRFIFEEF